MNFKFQITFLSRLNLLDTEETNKKLLTSLYVLKYILSISTIWCHFIKHLAHCFSFWWSGQILLNHHYINFLEKWINYRNRERPIFLILNSKMFLLVMKWNMKWYIFKKIVVQFFLKLEPNLKIPSEITPTFK